MSEITAFWKGSQSHGRSRRRAERGGLDLICTAIIGFALLGFIDPALWRDMPEAPYMLGLVLALAAFGLSRRGSAYLQAVLIALALGLGLVLLEITRLGAEPVSVLLLYLAGIVTGWLVIGSERYLPALGRIGDRSALLGFTARWQFLVAMTLAVRFSLFAMGRSQASAIDLLHAELGALAALTLLHFARIAQDRERKRRSDNMPPGIFLGLCAAGVQLLELVGLLAADWTFAISTVVIVSLMPAMIVGGALRSAPLIAALLATQIGMIFMSAAQAVTLWPDEAFNAGALIILFTLVSLAARLGEWSFSNEDLTGLSARFQNQAESWLVRLDFDNKTASLPLADMSQAHEISFANFFHASHPAKLLAFMSQMETRSLREHTEPLELAFELRVTLDDTGPRPVTAHVMSLEADHAWLALRALRDDEDLALRLENAESRMAAMRIREERLLSIASHEMRTPVTIIAMLAEELKSGANWKEVEFSFETSLERLTRILDDLRMTNEDTARPDTFTLGEIGKQLLDVFGAAATARGIELRLALSQHAETLLRGDPARIRIGVSKVVHNAIVHSKGTEVVIGALLTSENEEAGEITWIIKDDGCGVPPGIREALFTPFTGKESAGLGTVEGVGIGLYTARKAIHLLGGDIRLEGSSAEDGTEFVITHPVRITAELNENGRDKMTQENTTIDHPDSTALLIEDNVLVGELTTNRLRRIFGKVLWAETGMTGLELFRENTPDMVFVDQLLPGLQGNELIRQIRKIDSEVPIVGVTASTMGSECEVLEEAGANIAVEKPLSFAQIQLMVADFLGHKELGSNK
ncbi:hybrid sensor histidine kinase/response regulator [Thioclava sp. JE_KL1]|uniref:ATP-binding response regulator n=1 Tax=Thioclava sp. JE_KL1 TaxID=2651187 RepID=UPI00128D5149|nr:response regulator [Thioclava sp. JE_KL1]MPQ95979.1 response regulator [Thioclava sp. JE_KL1]